MKGVETMRKNQLYQYVLSLGHLCSDINQSILSAVLPFLIAAYHYDYTTAAMLVTVSNVFGSIVQPFFGSIADKYNKPYIISIGVLLAGGGMALTGFISNFYGLCVAVIISGIGVAMFHPQAAKLVSLSSDKTKQGHGISIFSFGGKIGSTLGPVLTSLAIVTFGIKGTIIFLIPAIIFGLISMFVLKNFDNLETVKKETEKTNVVIKDNWPGFIKLCAVVFGRSIITNGLSTFLALYFIQSLNQSETLSNTLVSVYYGIGAIATLFGGSLADKVGHRKMIRLSFMIFLPAMILFIATNNLYLALLMLIPLAIGESFSYSPMVVLGQQYLPNHTGFASGITLGLAVSVGGILCPVLGMIGDMYGLKIVLAVIAAIAGIALFFSYLLPEINAESNVVKEKKWPKLLSYLK